MGSSVMLPASGFDDRRYLCNNGWARAKFEGKIEPQ